ncbi:NAD(P)-binding protein [Glonium stellatum]|uniref:NAD(P)-binding protein n=1 Tax=Glonium stellatum TaxID=574774 RepID=A0A8E2FDA5_9PEZI|nr:NAD(P)-binding protein [Glonium stellatum]
MGLSLQGVLFITGAGGAIGRACVLQFARDGVTRISAVDISRASLQETADIVAAQFPAVEFLQNLADVTDEESVKTIFENTITRFGRIDYAVNNAAIGSPLLPTSEALSSDYDRVLTINLKGTWLCERSQLKIMAGQSPLPSGDAIDGRTPCKGAIINIDSVLGMMAVPGNALYTMSKHGLLGLTRSDALDFAKKGIRVNAVCPGFVNTPLITPAVKELLQPNIDKTPMGRLAHVQEIADGVVFLASERASYITGTTLTID